MYAALDVPVMVRPDRVASLRVAPMVLLGGSPLSGIDRLSLE